MNVKEGMRPRIHFPGSDFYIGNEGYEHVIEAYGAVSSQGDAFPYANNQEMKLTIIFSGEHFELMVNDQVKTARHPQDISRQRRPASRGRRRLESRNSPLLGLQADAGS